MKKLVTICAVVTMILAVSGVAQATDVTGYNVAPGDLASGKTEFSAPHGTGNNPFGYDWDSSAPTWANGAPTGYGSTSFSASVDGSAASEADRYKVFRVGFRSLFADHQPVTIGDLAEMSYFTNKNAAQNTHDWWVTIYTTAGDIGTDPGETATGAGDKAKWYRSALQTHPESSGTLNAPANTWNQWSTANTTNALENFYGKRSDSDMPWSDLQNGSTTWDYSGEEIMMIDIKLGWNSSGPVASSMLDGVKFTLTDGSVADINLVPEPMSMALLGLGGLGLLRRKRKA